MTLSELKKLARKAAEDYRDKAAVCDLYASQLEDALNHDDQAELMSALLDGGALTLSPWGLNLLGSPENDDG